MYKIDAHNHPDFHSRNFERLIANMDEYGIAKTALLTWDAPMDEAAPHNIDVISSPLCEDTVIPFERCLDYYEKAPDRFILGYAPDPRKPGAVRRMKAAVTTYGVQICGEIKLRMMYDSPDAIDLYRYCGEAGVPVILHFDNAEAQLAESDYPRRHYWYGGDIHTLERVLWLCPETNFLGHAPGFWCHISKDDLGYKTPYPTGPVIPGGRIEVLLDKYDNLYCDCSAGSCITQMNRDREYTKALILKHPDRFIFARDYFDNRLSDFIDSLGLPEDVLEGFYHGNIERILPEKAPENPLFS